MTGKGGNRTTARVASVDDAWEVLVCLLALLVLLFLAWSDSEQIVSILLMVFLILAPLAC